MSEHREDPSQVKQRPPAPRSIRGGYQGASLDDAPVNPPSGGTSASTPVSPLDGWKEAAIAWRVCASIHREYAKGKDPFFKTRQADFVRHGNAAAEKYHTGKGSDVS
jgi:hypothetical protein